MFLPCADEAGLCSISICGCCRARSVERCRGWCAAALSLSCSYPGVTCGRYVLWLRSLVGCAAPSPLPSRGPTKSGRLYAVVSPRRRGSGRVRLPPRGREGVQEQDRVHRGVRRGGVGVGLRILPRAGDAFFCVVFGGLFAFRVLRRFFRCRLLGGLLRFFFPATCSTWCWCRRPETRAHRRTHVHTLAALRTCRPSLTFSPLRPQRTATCLLHMCT